MRRAGYPRVSSNKALLEQKSCEMLYSFLPKTLALSAS